MDDLAELEARMQVATLVAVAVGVIVGALIYWLAAAPVWGTLIGLFIAWFIRQAFKAPYDAAVQQILASRTSPAP